jgi:hypothetical protein
VNKLEVVGDAFIIKDNPHSPGSRAAEVCEKSHFLVLRFDFHQEDLLSIRYYE